MSPFAYDVDSSNFQALVLDKSWQVPVVIDFWAEWCGPCRSLKPILERLAGEYQGRFLLAKIDSDRNPELAARYGVRGIPSVKAVYRGEVVDEFSGALPESVVRQFLDRVIPSPAEELRAQAGQQKAGGDLAGALQTLAEAAKLDAGNEAVRLDAAEILLDLGELDEAGRLLESLKPDTRQGERAARLLARLGFARSGQAGGDVAALRARVAAQPKDMDARLQLANLLIAQGDYAAGMDELLAMIAIDRQWNDQAARKAMLAVFNLLGGGELVAQYRRKLASALN